ncbi:MAG: hypothetical protein NVSMB23_08930 [Myxococcales bacterium]
MRTDEDQHDGAARAGPRPSGAGRAWSRRPATVVARLRGRRLLVLSGRDLLRAAADERVLLIALVAPAAAAMAGFARAARSAGAPLLLLRPSGAADERGPEEARDDAAFVEAALQEASAQGFPGPVALFKDPPRAGSAVPERERVQRELEAGFTSVAVTAQVDDAAAARDAALISAQVCQREIGLELVPLGGSLAIAAEVARQLMARGSFPSAIRLTGHEHEARAVIAQLGPVNISTVTETSPEALLGQGVQLLIASGPFVRALQKSAPREVLDQLQAWAEEKGASLEQAAARHQRLLRDLPRTALDRLEALSSFEALELFERAGVGGTASRLASRVGTYSDEG